MFDKLQHIEDKYENLNTLMSDPDVLNNPQELQKHAKTQSDLAEIVEVFRRYKVVNEQLEDAKALIEDKLDPEMKEMVELEIGELQEEKANLESKLKILLLPKDPNDEKNVIVEIRGGAGGDEAALFAAELYRMYTRYAETKGWKTDILSSHYTDIGGYKEVSFSVEGHGAYSKLKYESGVHRVQRVPSTESGGRIHTSTVTVAVLPEAEDVEVNIDANDLRIDVFCSSGPGGQSVNTTQSAVRVTHIPTGLVVSCQDEKSQHKNKDKALKVLRARLLEKFEGEQAGELAATRKTQVGTGDRSERIRTYNFPQGRVTDHRIGLTLHKLDQMLLGNIEEVIVALTTTDQAEKLKQVD
ncbi:bacterial peptide chain release factor 1 (bRF-1) [Desulfonispora thiosulfatigenes DSM 11270]|uniref:Peptide chain release factor 1 n=1 Tax=Desulfonispora thiosulfatigenes DSM 11270 TaxID=656914 RepID=A0A1W1V493_DESTI|nr:peptide chain release factor 1 [Desulfonispora thiosulfatigenes]SMB88135.1 bacterial peptide chain release factor 1 (bRF-1) [Desulfonispora thiosulfatigenes DSM 11270]